MHDDEFMPASLGEAGERLWRSIADEYDLSPDARRLLEDAARTADMIERLEKLAAGSTPTVRGSQGQEVIHPAISELRQYRNVLARLLSALKLEVDPTAEAEWRRDRARKGGLARHHGMHAAGEG